MKKPGLAVLIMLMIGSQSTAQKNFLPGYIIRNTGDTLTGLIDYRNWEQNPSRISFRSSAAEQEQSFSKHELRGFAVNGKDKYERVFVRRDMNPVTLNELTYNMGDSTLADSVFLRVIVEGNKLNLYEFVDFKSHYFIRPAGGQTEELLYKLSLHPQTGALVANNIFKIQLKKYLTGTALSAKELKAADQLQYELISLAKFVSMLNESIVSFTPQDAKKEGIQSKLFIGAGAEAGTLHFTGANEMLNSLQSNAEISYNLGVGVDLYSPRNLQKFLFRAEISLSGLSVNAAGTSGSGAGARDNTYSMKQTNITPSLSFLFNFIKTKTVKFYIAPAVGFNFSSYSTHLLTSQHQGSGTITNDNDFPELQKSWIATYIKGGVFIMDKFEINLNWLFGGSFIEYLHIHGASHPVALRVHYRF